MHDVSRTELDDANGLRFNMPLGLGLFLGARHFGDDEQSRKRWLVFAIALVWVTEAMNTAVEELCDRVSPEFDPSIGKVKDLATGAVLAASLAQASSVC